jgi:hypothetical protein
MPNYGSLSGGGVATEIFPGDSLILFNAESPTAPQASISLAMGLGAMGRAGITFTIAATAGTVQIQGSNQDVAGTYQTLWTTTNVANDMYADLGGFAYYRANITVLSSGTVTVIAQR